MSYVATEQSPAPTAAAAREPIVSKPARNAAQTASGKASRIYGSLDAWRGLAALAVIYFHAAEKVIDRNPAESHSLLYAPGMFGGVGVQVFFVISGFCIANAVCATLTLKRTTKSYAVARVRRIFPPMWISLVFYTLFSIGGMILMRHGTLGANFARVMPVDLRQVGLKFWFANLTLTQPWLNQQFLSGVCWTLCYEISFYTIMALLMSVRLFGGGVRAMLNLAHLTSAAALVALLLFPGSVPFPLDMWPQFGLGVLVYDLLTHRRNKQAAIAGITMVLLTLLFIVKDSTFVGVTGLREPSRLTYSVSLSFAALLLVLRAYDAVIVKLLPVRGLMQVGRASYSIYLTHGLCLMMLHLVMKLAHLEQAIFLQFAASFVLSVALGFVFFSFAERPFLNSAKPANRNAPADEPVTAATLAPAP